MKKKTIFLVVAFLLIAVAIYVWQRPRANTQAQDDAIRQAKEYRPEGMCTQSLVPAVHTATGAKYTFNNGCLAPGWKSAR